jgi:immune inhibitor A
MRGKDRIEDDSLFMIPPHPDLRKRLKEDFARARAAGGEAVARLLRMREAVRPGLNDGLIYPGNTFPLGTPTSVIRSAGRKKKPLRGTVRVAVVLAEFSDRRFGGGIDAEHYEKLFFSKGALPHGSVREYFSEVSGGAVDITGAVAGPLMLPRTLSAYAHGESGTSRAEPNARTMALDAAKAASAGLKFRPYDNNRDGYVDAFIVIHAGRGAEETGNDGDIWSHKWVLPGNGFAADGVRIYAYVTVPEDSRIGVCCHELGHLIFGFPDLYDPDYSSEGAGNWCLMAGGSWLGDGEIPAHPSAWCKAGQGWVAVKTPKAGAPVRIGEVKEGRAVQRLWKDGIKGSEYYLVENRQKTGFDARLPGDGLLVWHVDESVDDNTNEVHYKVALEQADGARHLEKGDNRGDAGDPYPGTSDNRNFTADSNPDSRSYAKSDTCVQLTRISASWPVMTAEISVKCAAAGKKPKPPSKKKTKKKPAKKTTKKSANRKRSGS